MKDKKCRECGRVFKEKKKGDTGDFCGITCFGKFMGVRSR